MSLSQIRTKTEDNITNIYTELERMGAVIPSQKNMSNLVECTKSISKIIYCTVKFNDLVNGIIAEQQIVYGHTIKNIIPSHREGYTFTYWSANDNKFDENTPITEDITLFANWKSGNAVLMENEAKGTTNAGNYILGYSRLGVPMPRSSIKCITFLENSNPPDAYYRHKFDVSKDNDGSVMCYIDNNANMYYVGGGTIELPVDATSLFQGYTGKNSNSVCGLEGLDLVYTSNTTNMSSLFKESYFTYLPLHNFDTSLVTDMSYMFYGCISTELTGCVSQFDTSSLVNMRGMFSSCKAITELSLEHFNTSNVTDMRELFAMCTQLNTLNISSWDVSNATFIINMFSGCSALMNLDTSGWQNDKAEYLTGIFRNCRTITNINLSGFTAIKGINSFANNCLAAEVIDIRGTSITGSNANYTLGALTNVPTTCEIYVADDITRDRLLAVFPNHNVIVAETIE